MQKTGTEGAILYGSIACLPSLAWNASHIGFVRDKKRQELRKSCQTCRKLRKFPFSCKMAKSCENSCEHLWSRAKSGSYYYYYYPHLLLPALPIRTLYYYYCPHLLLPALPIRTLCSHLQYLTNSINTPTCESSFTNLNGPTKKQHVAGKQQQLTIPSRALKIKIISRYNRIIQISPVKTIFFKR